MRFFRLALVAILIFIIIGTGGVRAEIPLAPESRAAALGHAMTAHVGGLQAAFWNPAGLTEPGQTTLLGPAVDVSAEVTRSLVEEAGDILDLVQDEFPSVADLEDFVRDVANGRPIDPDQRDAVIRLVGQEIPALANPRQGLLTQVSLFWGWRGESDWGIYFREYLGSGLHPYFDHSPERLSIFDAGTPESNVASLLGLGSDRSGEFVAEEAQGLADEIAVDTVLSQEQAETLVWIAETNGARLEDGNTRQILKDFATAISRDPEEGATILDNRTGVRGVGAIFSEFALGKGWEVTPNVRFGGTLRLIQGVMLQTDAELLDPGLEDDLRAWINPDHRSLAWNATIDLGVQWDVRKWLTLGVAGRNLTRPAFELPLRGSYRFEPQVRVGAALRAGESLLLAVDLDLLETTESALPAMESRQFSLGVEWRVWSWFALQTGYFQEVGGHTNQDAVSLGLQFEFGPVRIGLNGALSGKWERVRTGDNLENKVRMPTYGQVALQVAWVSEPEEGAD